MQNKLTLRLDDGLIQAAKAYAAVEGRSLSALVASYFERLQLSEPARSKVSEPVQIRQSRFYGLAANASATADSPAPDEANYRQYLQAKHQ